MTLQANLLSATAVLLRPLVRILLKHGVPYGAFAETARKAYVDVAGSEFGIPNRKQTASRISVLTGLTRKDVARLLEGETTFGIGAESYHRAARVVSGWVREFGEPDGSVADLPLDGATGSFTALVRRYSGDMPVRAVLDELVRVGTVVRLDDNRLRLTARAYLPRSADVEKLGILGRDVADLIASIDHNLTDEGDPYFQRKVEYDNLPTEALPALHRLLARNGQSLLEKLDGYMSSHDRDANPEAQGSGRKRAVVGLYYYEEDAAAPGRSPDN